MMLFMTKEIVISDFDGTIVMSNIAEQILTTFCGDTWLQYEELFASGKLSLEETLVAEYSLIKTSKEIILEEIDRITTVRKNFVNFANHCFNKGNELIIVSAGIDFTLEHILLKLHLPQKLKIFTVITQYNPDGSLKVTKPIRFNESITDFKLDIVQHYKELGYYVRYIGDSVSDFQAVKGADRIYSIRNSKLSAYCKKKNFPFIEFDDFDRIIHFWK